MTELNQTHNPELTCWLESANRPDSDFPIQNLPYAAFRRAGSAEPFRIGVAIGDQVLDLQQAARSDLFTGLAAEAVAACDNETLNAFMALGREYWSALRARLSELLSSHADASTVDKLKTALCPQSEVEYQLPCQIGDYTDFYTSIHHATRVGSLFRPDNPLLPNYQWIPIGYHGRASSVVISGHDVRRPQGQTRAPDAAAPTLGPCKRLDYELELGVLVGSGNPLGSPVSIDQAESHIFGLCLLNDWSARDLQAWEYQPLGPFLSKSFLTSLSPWVVTMEALAPFRAAWTRSADEPQPLDYLDSTQVRQQGAVDIRLAVELETASDRAANRPGQQVSQSSFIDSYWTLSQMLTHHTVNGCNLQPGDLLGTGTQSGPQPEESGSLLELSQGGKQPLQLNNGEQRTFLEDGDRVTLRGWCEAPGARRIGFGSVTGSVLPA